MCIGLGRRTMADDVGLVAGICQFRSSGLGRVACQNEASSVTKREWFVPLWCVARFVVRRDEVQGLGM